MAVRRLCAANTKAGAPCRAFALTDSEYCISHSPEHREQHLAAARAGGVAKATSIRTAKEWMAISRHLDYADLPTVLIGAGLACLNGQIEPSRVTALATALRAAAAISETAILEKRIRDLEQLIGEE